MIIEISMELQRQEEERHEQTEDFDENAYLTGQVSIIGGQPKIPYTPKGIINNNIQMIISLIKN